MAGHPDASRTVELALACARGGADILELGIPFSDPIADGPIIQKAGQEALAHGTTVKSVLHIARDIRDRSEIPIVLMSYLNPILSFGDRRFAVASKEAGVDGLIVPDLPLEEADRLSEALQEVDIDLILLVAPSTPPHRAKVIASSSRGFLYMVARYGTTGIRDDIPPDLPDRVRTFKRLTSLPLAVGFGVSSVQHVAQLAMSRVDGIVVGSALVKLVDDGADKIALESFVQQLSLGLSYGVAGGP